MKRRLSLTLVGAFLLASLIAGSITVFVASAHNTAHADAVTNPITIPAGDTLVLRTHVQQGVQIYQCINGSYVNNVVGTGPQAILADKSNRPLIYHFRNGTSLDPSWLDLRDGSSVTAHTSQSVVVDPNSIPWLGLTATSNNDITGVKGGILSNVNFVRRIETSGGKAPASCTANQEGSKVFVPYHAVYEFYAPTSVQGQHHK